MGPAFPTLIESIMTALVTRLLSFLFALVVASLLLFVAIKVVPGTAAGAALGIDATPQAIARFNATHGLDRPVYVQYLEWASNTLHGDFGTSFQNGVDVGPELGRRFLVTLELAGLAFIVANLIAIPSAPGPPCAIRGRPTASSPRWRRSSAQCPASFLRRCSSCC